MVLTREERKRLVLDLYNQGKGTREIAKELRMSFKDITPILKKQEKRRKLVKSRQKRYLYQHKLTNFFLKIKLTRSSIELS
jgi:transposase